MTHATLLCVLIKDLDSSGMSAVSLAQLLDVLSDRGPSLEWWVLDLDATGEVRATWPGGIPELVSRAHAGGLSVSWAQLQTLAEGLTQIMDCTIEGCDHEGKVQVRVQSNDGDLWRIATTDPGLIGKISEAFSSVSRIQDPSKWE